MTGPGHHDLTLAPATASLTIPAAPARRAAMHPILRRVIYVGGYEALSVLFTVLVLGGMLGHSGGQATLTAVLLSTTATIWNYAWNTLFERAERRFGWTGRGVLVRLGHAFGYEGGVLVFTVPLVAFMLGVTLPEALVIEASLLVFFLVFTYVYSWAFDRIVGLPESARKALPCWLRRGFGRAPGPASRSHRTRSAGCIRTTRRT